MEPARNHVCRSCRLRLASSQPTARSFSTSSSRRVVPPESPNYVDIPSSYQPYMPFTKQQKGTLPVPREIFPASRPDKPSGEYLANATKDRLEKNQVPREQLSEAGKYKMDMAQLRKDQLRKGLTGLHQRKQSEINTMAQKSRAKQSQRDDLLTQPPREDERLTNVSTPMDLAPNAQTSLAALEAEVATAKRIHATKMENLTRINAEKKANKMDALHTLYMNARSFVTTEDQLKALIHEQFDPGEQLAKRANFASTVGVGQSMWNFGPPAGIKEMVGRMAGKQGEKSLRDAVSRVSEYERAKVPKFAREQERMKRIAEKLSGGKI